MGNQTELAKLLGISSDYVSMIETSKREPGPRLLKDFEELERKLGQAVSEKTDSVTSGVALGEESPEYVTIAECKQRINELNQEVERLRAALHAISAPRPVSSSPPSAAAELARRAGGDAGKNPKS